MDQVSLSETAKNKAASSKAANQAAPQPSEAATQSTTASYCIESQNRAVEFIKRNATNLKPGGDSQDSSLLSRALAPQENERYTQYTQLKARGEWWGLEMPEFMQYYIRAVPGWYADAVTAPINTLQQQGDQVPYSDMDKEQAQALIEEYHQALDESLNRAFDNLGIKTPDGAFDALHSPTKSVKLREELSRIMYGDSRIRDIMSRLNIDIKSILGVEV
jgi:hypothetical protein